MKSKKRKTACSKHKSKNRKWNEYWFGYVDHNGIERWHCIKCKEENEKEMNRLERIIANEKKQRDEADQIYWAKSQIRQAKREQNIKENLWDFVVIRELKRDMKKQHLIEFPKELIQLKRATMKLQRVIKSASGLPILIEMPHRKVYQCNKHGIIYLKDLIKIQYSSKKYGYKCKKCIKENLYE